MANDNPNCQLALNFNYICDCEGPGYAGADSPAKKKALVWVPRLAAILSFCGSSAIIVDIVRAPAKRTQLRNQLLVMMSAFDLMGSAAYALTSLPIPEGESKCPLQWTFCWPISFYCLICFVLLIRASHRGIARQCSHVFSAGFLHTNGDHSCTVQCVTRSVLLFQSQTWLVRATN